MKDGPTSDRDQSSLMNRMSVAALGLTSLVAALGYVKFCSIDRDVGVATATPSNRRLTVKLPCSCTSSRSCWRITDYSPSAWETDWSEKVMGEYHDRECEQLRLEFADSVAMLLAIQTWSSPGSANASAVSPAAIKLFSRMTYTDTCNIERDREQLIEPLVGHLRDPLTMCGPIDKAHNALAGGLTRPQNPIQSKKHLLLGLDAPWRTVGGDGTWITNSPWVPRTNSPSPATATPSSASDARLILFDLGASTYSSWHTAAALGTKWFVEQFKRSKASIDRVIAFEFERHKPGEVYRGVPDDLLPAYTYVNVGVDADYNGRFNPWRWLHAVATENDHVVIKLDIDTPSIENALVAQLLRSTPTTDLVDEMFYEHHVNVICMERFWSPKKENLTATLRNSYDDFASLRRAGVRMHSWP